jgi:GAF domain-containing protein
VKRVLPVDRTRRLVIDRLVRLAADLAEAPIAFVTIVEEDRQVFVAQIGLPEDIAAEGSTPIEYSICQHAVSRGRPLVVGDARRDALLRDHPAVVSLGVAAYAGMPVIIEDTKPIGTLCVVDVTARDWSADLLAQLTLLADVVADQFELQEHERAAAFRRMWRGVPEYARY